MPTPKTDPPPATTPDHDTIAHALVAFQAEMPVVHKARKATVPTKNGGSYSYTYADLTDVMAAAIPLLVKHGLSFTARPRLIEGKAYELVGVLQHVSGPEENIEGALPLYGNSPQEIGGAITYARRYLLGCLTGLVTDDDDDAVGQRLNPAGRTEPEPAGPEPYQVELFAELSALSPGVVALVQERWPFPSTDVYTFTRGECQQVRAIVDLAIAEVAKAAESPDPVGGEA